MFPFVASKYCEATMHPVYHAKITVSTKNLPPLEGRALHTSPSHRISIYFSDILPCRFNSFTRSLKVSTLPILEGKRLAGNLAPQTEHEREIGSFFACSGAFEVNSPKVDPQFYRCPATMGNDWGSSCHGYTDRGRVERGIERELYFTEPPDFHIFFLYPPASAGGESATFPRMFSSSAS